MKFKQIKKTLLWLTMLLAVLCVIPTACSSSGLTKKQREVMEHHVDETADAIVFSATKVKKLLVSYKQEHGSWPKQAAERRKIFNKIDEVLEEHNISNQNLLEIDKQEVIVEYELSPKKFKQFPQLLESWVIIFAQEPNTGLKIMSIYPHWCNTEETSQKTLYSVEQVKRLRGTFQQLLQEKLTAYSITLSEHIDEKG